MPATPKRLTNIPPLRQILNEWIDIDASKILPIVFSRRSYKNGMCQRISDICLWALSLVVFRLLWRVYPDGGRDHRWFGWFLHEALWRFLESCIEGRLACVVDSGSLTEVDLVWRHQADPGVMVIVVVSSKEASAKRSGFVDGIEPIRKLWLIFQRLEVGFREGVIVGGVGPALRFQYTKINEHRGGGFGLYRAAAVGV